MSSKQKILIVDDEASIREFLEIMLKKEKKYEITLAEDGEQAINILKKKSFDLVISDLQMPNKTGMDVLEYINQMCPQTMFMLITAFGSTEIAVEAMKLGAYDYITKPFKLDEVRINISHALESVQLEKENRTLKRELKRTYNFENLVGNSEKMHEVYHIVKRVSLAPTNVLVTGESGTGKEVIAKAIHYNGPLKEAPFITVNCGAIPENLMESEMFGHKKGSFTGAVQDKMGLFQAAQGGTLFLDEVGELPLNIQVKLLRALQERIIRPVGSTENIKVDLRIIAATNRNLEEMVAEGTFRQDLYYRLNVINIHAPALRDRPEDVPLLAMHFLHKFNERLGRDVSSISAEALEKLENYNFPGNVRELENIIERSMALEVGNSILPESLPPLVQTESGKKYASVHEIIITDDGVELDKIMDQIEKEMLLKAMHASDGVKKHAAKLLGISFRSMRYRAEKHNLNALLEDDEIAS
ncbi:MAG: sigma-54-dependent transcriptional regulator [Bdellovibrionales bacterium]